jgi:hypothetical protein
LQFTRWTKGQPQQLMNDSSAPAAQQSSGNRSPIKKNNNSLRPEKLSQKVEVLRYTDDEYSKLLTRDDWSREETDYLLDLCENFDLRFIIIADRYEFAGTAQRSIEVIENLR